MTPSKKIVLLQCLKKSTFASVTYCKQRKEFSPKLFTQKNFLKNVFKHFNFVKNKNSTVNHFTFLFVLLKYLFLLFFFEPRGLSKILNSVRWKTILGWKAKYSVVFTSEVGCPSGRRLE